MIILENVSKAFHTTDNTVHAVTEINLQVKATDIFGIVGLSGAGKSTLIRLINLLERPDKGKVLINGKDLCLMSPKELRQERKKISMIFQHFNLFPSRNVFQNIAFPLHRTGLTKKEIENKVRYLLDTVDMLDKELAYPSELSGGQQQRVAIARALANDPEILLCDEATSSLDPKTTVSILNLLQELNEKLGLTIVLITHEMEVVKEICHKVAVMENGHMVEENDTFSIFAHPTNLITKELVGQGRDLEKMKDLIDRKSPMVAIDADATMVKLTYLEDSSKESLISHVSRDFLVDVNIIFGNIDIIDHRPIGELIAILKGTTMNRTKATAYLESQHVSVEVIQHGSLS